MRSSIAGRRLPSGQRSPAGMTATAAPCARAAALFATALAFLKQPARTGTLRTAAEMDAPFGLGSTSLVPASIAASEEGDRLNRYPVLPRDPASSAPMILAASAAALRSP